MSQLSVYEFGEALLNARDLDPVYTILHHGKLSNLKEYLLAYWCFYHVGTASWIVDQPDYWKAMETAAGSKDWPRSSERRHFRGNNAIQSVAYLKSKGVYDLFKPLTAYSSIPVARVMRLVQEWAGFGPWIAFKVADMLERLGLCEVRFNSGAMFLFDSPKEGAELAWEKYGKGNRPEHVGEWAVASILSHLALPKTRSKLEGRGLAPPDYGRLLGVQEAETILCKWKSYLGGHYKIGEDVESVHKGLERFKDCRTSQRLMEAGREGKLW